MLSLKGDSGSSIQEGLTNAMIIRGPPGVGKTSLVYYIAQRLGFTVSCTFCSVGYNIPAALNDLPINDLYRYRLLR